VKYGLRVFYVSLQPDGSAEGKRKLIEDMIGSKSLSPIAEIDISTEIEIQGRKVILNGINENNRYMNIIKGRGFDTDDIVGKRSAVIIPAGSGAVLSSVYTLPDGDYTVCGLAALYNNTRNIYIPYTTYLDKGYDISGFMFVLYDKPDAEQIQAVEKIVEGYEGHAELTLPDKTDAETMMSIAMVTIVIITIMMLCMINVAGMIRYWLEENKFKFIVYKLCGADKKNIRLLLYIEELLIGLAGIAGGYLLYSLFVPLIRGIDFYYELRPVHYITVTAIYFATMSASLYKTQRRVSAAMPADKTLWE
jgi:ABC-type antimicrobial peptide transport system permease subunit